MTPVTVVSDATASTPSAGYNAKPIYYNGRAYVFLRNGTTNVSVYSATFDDTSGFGTFTEEDSANRPGSGSTTITQIESMDVAQDPDTPTDVYVLVYGTVSGGNYQMEWSRFDMSNTTNDAQGSWETIENAVLAATFVKLAGSDRGTISVRTDGDIVVLYNGPSDKNHGTDYARVYYTRYNGSAWSTPALVEGTTGDTVTYNYPVQVMGKSDLAHFFWYNGTNWKTASFTSGDTLNTLQNIGTSFDNTTAKSHPIYYLSGTDELIYFVHKASDGHPQYNLITNDGTPGSDTEMDDVAIFNQGSPWQETMQLGIDPTDGSLWLGYADNSTQDVWRVDDSGWGTATEVADGQTIEDMSINVVETDESAVCMLFCWQDDTSSAMEVEYYVITAGSSGVTVNVTAKAIASAGIATSITPGAVSVSTTAAVVDSAGIAATISAPPPAQTVTTVTQPIASAGHASTVTPGAVSVPLTAGTIASAGHAATITPGAISVQATAGTIASSGIATTISNVAPSITINLTTQPIASAGIPATVTPGAISVALNAGTIASAGQAATISIGGVSIPLTAATIASSGHAATITIGGVTISLTAATIASAGIAATITPGAISVPLTAGVIASSGHAASIASGGASISLTAATITSAGQAATITPGGVTIATITQPIASAGQTATISNISGSVINLIAATIASAGQATTITPGAVSIAAITDVIASAGIAAAISNTSPGITISLTTQPITSAGIAATVTPGGVSIPLTTAPIISAGQTVTVSNIYAQTISLTAAVITSSGHIVTITAVAPSTYGFATLSADLMNYAVLTATVMESVTLTGDVMNYATLTGDKT